MSDPFHIAILGGGIGGLFTALCIHHHHLLNPSARPIQISVYEARPAYREIGAGVGLGINAARLVHKLGLGERLNAFAGRRQGVWITFRRFDDGREVVTVPVKDDEVVRQAPCARSDLLELLKAAVEERGAAVLWTGKTGVRVEDCDTKIRIHFSDSTTAFADIVVAADGIHSPTRSQFVPDKPTFANQIAYRGVIPIAALTSWPYVSYSACWLAKHRHFLTFPIASETLLNVVAFVTKSAEEAGDVEESWVSTTSRSNVERDFLGFEKTVQEIISLMPEQPSRWRINDREPLAQWSYMNGKVILLGDAAHAMLPHLGAGAGQAMEDGWVLGRALSEYLTAGQPANPHFTSLATTTALYQSSRLPRAQKAQAASRVAGDSYELQTKEMEGMEFEAALEVMAQRTEERMRWVWEEDLDERYEGVRDGPARGLL